MRDITNGDWIRGYTAALLDVKEQIANIEKLSKNNAIKMMDMFIEHRQDLREGKGFFFINGKTKELKLNIDGKFYDR